VPLSSILTRSVFGVCALRRRRPVFNLLEPDPATVYLRWVWSRALLHRGWWLVTSVYLVADARLSGTQLVLIGVAQALTGLVCEVPAGAMADAVGRKRMLVASHVLMGTAMLATGLVTDYPALVATQMIWGLSWNLAGGADVAWITDELGDPDRITGVLVRSGQAQLAGAAAGLVGVGALAAVTARGAAMVTAGIAMLGLGGFVALRFPERRFVRVASRRPSASWAALVDGSAAVRRNAGIVMMIAATFLINAAAVFGLLQTRRLIELGFPTTPIVWFVVLGVLTLLTGVGVFRLARPRLDDGDRLLWGYALACAVGAAGVSGLAAAPDAMVGSACVVVAGGVALPMTATLGTIWVNRQTTSDVRATVLSYLGLAEFAAEICGGLAIATIARSAGMGPALAACAGLFAAVVALVALWAARRR
jgi:MFS family permease